MSLVAMILRVAAVQALKGVTLAGDRVYDSAIDPLDVTVAGDPKPFLCVYTEDEVCEAPQGRDLTALDGSLEFILRYAVADRAEAPGEDDQGAPTTILIPQTDAGLEVVLDVLRRQAVRILQAGQGPFADLWRQLVTEIKRINIRRGAGSEKGLRYAAREMIISVGTIADPPLAGVTPANWQAIIATLRAGASAEPFCGAVADIVAKECDGASATLTDQMLAALGLPIGLAEVMGFAPVARGDVGMVEGTLEDVDQTSALTLDNGVASSFGA